MRDADTVETEEKPEAEAEKGAEDGTPQADGSGGEAPAKEEEDAEPSAVESAKEPTPPPAEPVIRRKRLGRPPKNKPPDWDLGVVVSDDTPRRRGRGGWRGRGGRKGAQPAQKLQQTIDKDGTVVDIANDECVLPEDPEGETKVDKLGNLMGGRDYRCRIFTVHGRGDRMYMLSTEPARCVGFRDSYLFFTKHLKLHKIIVDDEEKRDMIEREIIPHSYKGRAIGIVTARSVFREFGARIIIGGRRIIDDYDVARARAEGAVEGEIADPTDRFVEGEPYNKNQYVAWHGASAVYHQGAPAVQTPTGKPEVKKRRVNVNDTNWMLEHAREARSVFLRPGFVRLATNIIQQLQRHAHGGPSIADKRHLRHPYQHDALPRDHAAHPRADRAAPTLGRRAPLGEQHLPRPPAAGRAQLLRRGHAHGGAALWCLDGSVQRHRRRGLLDTLQGPGCRLGGDQGSAAARVPAGV